MARTRCSVLGLLMLSLFCVCRAIPSREFFRTALTPSQDGGKTWVLLAAGSSGWMNYRHQADVCHAYQVFRAHQIPASQIVTMMFDDIATSFFNTIKGKVFNEPYGVDVYAGVQVDYRGRQVNPKNFLAVLAGDKDKMHGIGSGRVIESGGEDKVVVYFADHGAPGLLAFPSSFHLIPHALFARPLLAALHAMHAAHKYGSMLWYVEACESGSMFAGVLGAELRVLAMTAAAPAEPSMACTYNYTLGVYLADCFSLHLWRFEDSAPAPALTLDEQYQRLRATTNSSHLCLYGDLSLANLPVATFIPATPTPAPAVGGQLPSEHGAVSSRYVTSSTLRRRVEGLEGGAGVGGGEVEEARAALAREEAREEAARSTFHRLLNALAPRHSPLFHQIWNPQEGAGECERGGGGMEVHSCVEEAARGVEARCGPFTDHSLMYVGVLWRACAAAFSPARILLAAEAACPDHASLEEEGEEWEGEEEVGARCKCHSLSSQAACTAAPCPCHWCTSAAVPSKCYSEAEAKKLPPAIFSCS